jgi:hypothetical protein
MTRTAPRRGARDAAAHLEERSAERILGSRKDQPIVEARALLRLNDDPAAEAEAGRFVDAPQPLADALPQARTWRHAAAVLKIGRREGPGRGAIGTVTLRHVESSGKSETIGADSATNGSNCGSPIRL